MKRMIPCTVFLWRYQWFISAIIWLCMNLGPRWGNWLMVHTPLHQALRRFYWHNGMQPFEVTTDLADDKIITG